MSPSERAESGSSSRPLRFSMVVRREHQDALRDVRGVVTHTHREGIGRQKKRLPTIPLSGPVVRGLVRETPEFS